MEYIVGAVLALVVVALARRAGFERERPFYPLLLIVAASYYDLFAVMGGSAEALIFETVVLSLFILVAVIGFKTNLWIVAGALMGHGTLDFFHAGLIANPGVPAWWPMFCMTFDIAAGGYLAFRLLNAGKRENRYQVPMRSPLPQLVE